MALGIRLFLLILGLCNIYLGCVATENIVHQVISIFTGTLVTWFGWYFEIKVMNKDDFNE